MSQVNFLQNAMESSKGEKATIVVPTQSKTTNTSMLTIEELTKIAKAQKESQQAANPNWFAKQNRRAIPGTLIKRTAVKAEQDATEEEDQDNYSSNLSSQATKKILSSFRKIPAMDDDQQAGVLLFNPTEEEDDGLPPRASMNDANYDDDFYMTSDAVPKNTTDSINKEPMHFKNAFNSNIRGPLMTNSAISTSKETLEQLNLSTGPQFGTIFGVESGATPKPSDNTNVSHPSIQQQQRFQECAVLVFGYDDKVFDYILQHFSKYGIFLENFNMAIQGEFSSFSSPMATPLKTPQKQTYPIFIGKSWVKLTYQNATSAIRACRDNELKIAGSKVNVIPYSKEILERFLHNKVSSQNDIGDSLSNLNITRLSNVDKKFEPLLQDTPIMDASKRNRDVIMNTSIKMKNGNNLFINQQKKTNAKQEVKTVDSFFKKASDMLFGTDQI